MPGYGGPPRRRPYPWDAIINGTGVLLAPGGDKSEDLKGGQPRVVSQVSPTSYKSSAQNPNVEVTYEYGDLSLGMGLAYQVGEHDRRYRYADAADCSIANQTILGPRISSITPSSVDSTNGVSGFFEIGGGLYAVNGRYVPKRTSDAD